MEKTAGVERKKKPRERGRGAGESKKAVNPALPPPPYVQPANSSVLTQRSSRSLLRSLAGRQLAAPSCSLLGIEEYRPHTHTHTHTSQLHRYTAPLARLSAVHAHQPPALHVHRVEDGRVERHECALDAEAAVQPAQPAGRDEQPQLTRRGSRRAVDRLHSLLERVQRVGRNLHDHPCRGAAHKVLPVLQRRAAAWIGNGSLEDVPRAEPDGHPERRVDDGGREALVQLRQPRRRSAELPARLERVDRKQHGGGGDSTGAT
mmetsp:Transcript_18498/g.54805  ORF Transcript_18498/g.54805 Transcript_18498/m.54805 type:complete len:261 (+) Transcript_18498:939-1721(+)